MSGEIVNIGEFQKFNLACRKEGKEIMFKALVDVSFKKGNKLCFRKEFPIRAIMNHNGGQVDVMWEDEGETEFREMGLYGTYNTRYAKMKYYVREKYLEIRGTNSNKIVRIYV